MLHVSTMHVYTGYQICNRLRLHITQRNPSRMYYGNRTTIAPQSHSVSMHDIFCKMLLSLPHFTSILLELLREVTVKTKKHESKFVTKRSDGGMKTALNMDTAEFPPNCRYHQPTTRRHMPDDRILWTKCLPVPQVSMRYLAAQAHRPSSVDKPTQSFMS
jgi:hypothetical protein